MICEVYARKKILIKNWEGFSLLTKHVQNNSHYAVESKTENKTEKRKINANMWTTFNRTIQLNNQSSLIVFPYYPMSFNVSYCGMYTCC
jgi:hypothetical protein